MKVATANQIKKIDKTAIDNIGIPGIVLMENAALKVVDEVIKTVNDVDCKSIVIFCGKGNNGGDGLAVARHLHNMGANVLVILLAEDIEIKGDALTNLDILKKMGVRIVNVCDKSYLEETAASVYMCDIIIDALLGTGVRGNVEGIFADIIELINYSGRYVISVDIPSGISSDTGNVCGICVDAGKTVTFSLPKIGLLIHPGAAAVGELIVADISIPASVIESQDININTIEKNFVEGILPLRWDDSNKGTYGKVFIIAGSSGMTGAAVLAAGGALRCGCGSVTVGIASTLSHIIATKLTEAMTLALDDDGNGVLSVESVDKILQKTSESNVLVIGPGLSCHPNVLYVLENVLLNCELTIVIDADAISMLSQKLDLLKQTKCHVVLTPHPGEMSRLTGFDIPYIQSNRIDVARNFAKSLGVTLVLKGSRSLVACSNGDVYINCTGNSGMATAGSGDVLSGAIASLAAQGLTAEQSAVAGVYIHGLAGDLAKRQKGEYGLIAGDIVDALPNALNR